MIPTSVEFRAADGHPLSALVFEPAGGAKAVLLLGHAMMANARSMDRPRGAGLASCLAARGYRCYCLDARGHGNSGPGASRSKDWSYDDIMFRDLPSAVIRLREWNPGLKLAVVGHSLFGHGCLGMLGRNPGFPIDAVVSIAGNIWLPRLDRDRTRRFEKTCQLLLMYTMSKALGRLPVRALRFGSDDEARTYTHQFWKWWRADAWTTLDGSWDFLQGMSEVRRPVLAIAGAGDRLFCHPDCSREFVSYLTRAELTHQIVGVTESGLPFNPGHMQLVTDERCRPAWERVGEWLDERLK